MKQNGEKDLLKNDPGLLKWSREISDVAGFLWQKGWAERNAGNISVNISEILKNDKVQFNDIKKLPKTYSVLSGKTFLITCKGSKMRHIAQNPWKHTGIVQITNDGKGYAFLPFHEANEEFPDPTSELPTHLAIHASLVSSFSENKVIIHTHPLELVVITHDKEWQDKDKINQLLWGMHPETSVFIPEGIGYIPYIPPGTEEIANATALSLLHHRIVLWEKHGVFGTGKNVEEAFDLIDILNKSATIYLACKRSGIHPEGLTYEQIDVLRKMGF